MKKSQIKTKTDDALPVLKIEDSILAGIFISFGHNVIPFTDGARVKYEITGDFGKTLQQISSNEHIGSLDALNGIKAARQMIYMLRARGANG